MTQFILYTQKLLLQELPRFRLVCYQHNVFFTSFLAVFMDRRIVEPLKANTRP